MKPVALASTAVAAVLIAGCGASHKSTEPIPLPAVQAAGPTKAQNEADTRAEAQRLLGLAPIPAGARSTDKHGGLDSPALGTTESDSLIDASSFWHVDEPMEQVWTWVRTHRPHGLRDSGTSSGGGPSGVTGKGIAWSEPDRGYGIEFALEISHAPDNNGASTTIRADGVGQWLDPQPTRDDNPGRHVRVTMANGCPSHVPSLFDVTNSGDDLDRALLPHASPTAALVCFYFGSNGKPPFSLAGHHRLDPEAAHALAQRFASLRIAHTDGNGPIPCPFMDGTVDVVAFSYADRADVDLLNPVGGCPSVSNGHILVPGSIGFAHPPNAFTFGKR